MNPSCTFTEQGLVDIEDIVRYIAEDNVQAALEVESVFYDAFDLIAQNPRIGHLKPEWTQKPYRFWTVRNHYLVVYDERGNQPCILRVISSYREIPVLLPE
jgi:antitoxin ParD1/3/4/toxin ParE1/3/4